MTPEGRVKAKVDRALKKHFGVRCYPFKPVQNGMGAPGLDYYCCIAGLFVAIETKVPGKGLTPRQSDTRSQIIGAGGIVFVIHDENEIDAMVATMLLAMKARGVHPR